jgi:hypothetical protein
MSNAMHENAKARGKGDSGQSLPEATGQNTEESMANSLPDTNVSDVMKGYSGGESMTGDTKSDPMDMGPGCNNCKDGK